MRGSVILASFSAAATPERGERLVVVDVGGRDGGDHGRLGVAPEVLPEEPRQHGVAVRDEVGLLLLLPAGARGGRRRGLERMSNEMTEYLVCTSIQL